MDRIFKITDDFCLFNGNILDFDSPIDTNFISKINPYGGENKYNQICNEYIIGQKLSKYSEFLTAIDCQIIQRTFNDDSEFGDKYFYENIRDEYIFENCGNLVKDIDSVEVYVYQKSGNDLQHYFDNPDKLYNLLTKNNTINIYDGINILILYFINILIILYNEKIIHKDIKPGNIIVGDDLINFPENIKIIDLGFSFQYKNFSDFTLNQAIDFYGYDILEDLKNKYMTDDFSILSYHFSIDLYNDDNLDDFIHIFNVITSVATPDYSAPEFDIRLSTGFISPTISSMICPDIRNFILELRNDIPQYIITNQQDIDYTELLQLYLKETDDYYDFIKNNTIEERKIETIIDYNKINNTNYNLFEIVYIMANGLTGPNPLIYKYDLYAFGLILQELINTYKLYDPRKYRVKKTKRNSITKKKKGGSPLKSYDYNDKVHNKEFNQIQYVIDNMINPDCIYRWSLNDLIDFYSGNDIINEKYIDIMGVPYLLCSTDINVNSIIKQFKIIDPNLKNETFDIWDNIRKILKKSGMAPRKIIQNINKWKRQINTNNGLNNILNTTIINDHADIANLLKEYKDARSIQSLYRGKLTRRKLNTSMARRRLALSRLGDTYRLDEDVIQMLNSNLPQRPSRIDTINEI